MCKIMEELREEGYNEGWAGGEARKAKETACKLAGRGDSADIIADMVGYDVQTVETWLKECENLRF